MGPGWGWLRAGFGGTAVQWDTRRLMVQVAAVAWKRGWMGRPWDKVLPASGQVVQRMQRFKVSWCQERAGGPRTWNKVRAGTRLLTAIEGK